MIKKLSSLFLAILLVLSLAACSGSKDSNDNDDPDTNHGISHFGDITFQETVFVDDESCTFTIKSIDPDGDWGYTLNAFLENKTDLNLMFSLNDVSVNGFMCDPFWASQVSAGMKANEEISFYESSLEDLGITDITEITFTLCVYDYDDFAAEPLVEETFTIYPMGEDAVETYVRTPVDNEIVLFENEDVTMIVIGQEDDSMWGYTLVVYLENNTDRMLMFSAGDVAVNGFMCDPYWGTTVAPGKRAIVNISWSDDAFAENDITEVESITMPITVFDYNDWMADYLIDDTFTIEPKF